MTLAVRKVFIDSRSLVPGDSAIFDNELPEFWELPKSVS